MKYLIPVDGSTASLRAVNQVVHELETQESGLDPSPSRPRSSVVLLSVQPHLPRHATRFVSKAECRRFRDERARTSLSDASAVLKQAGVPFASMIAEGDVADAVIREANHLRVDEIRLGVHRKPDWMRRVMPSISQRIIDGADVPVALLSEGHPGPMARYAVPAGLGLGLTMLVLSD